MSKEEPANDYRSSRMPSSEGHGHAMSALHAMLESLFGLHEHGAKWSELSPVPNDFNKMLVPFARQGIQGFSPDLIGFWLLWHAEGGFEGMQRLGMSDTTIWRRIRAFRDAFGAHPDDFEMPGVTIDLERYWVAPENEIFISGGKLLPDQ